MKAASSAAIRSIGPRGHQAQVRPRLALKVLVHGCMRPHRTPGDTQRAQQVSLCKNTQCSPAKVSGGACTTGSSCPPPRRPPGLCLVGRSSQSRGCLFSNAASLGLKIALGPGCILSALGAEMGRAPSLAGCCYYPTNSPARLAALRHEPLLRRKGKQGLAASNR